jgi:hypothetical protein
MRRNTLLALGASPALATLPYNPTRLIPTHNGSNAYVFAPVSSTQFSLAILDTANVVSAASPPLTTLYQTLPFLSSSKQRAFIPLVDDGGDIEVLAGDCTNTAQGLELWRFTTSDDGGTWSQSQITLSDTSLSADYLSAGFTFSPTNTTTDTSVYVFGGMCPNQSNLTSSDWTTQASYSNTMLTISTGTTSTVPLDVSMTGIRTPPIAEAGLSITPLMPTYSNISGNVSVQQNFVLLGGHTQQAFINMSQVALFTLPEESWAFLAIDQHGSDANIELAVRAAQTVEPRSGHTAVMTDDGTQILVFGGWVGDISTPATPQLAVLEIGQEYGGSSNWAWTVPTQNSGISGLYGHGATMLPGGVMMISGGYDISSSNAKRATQMTSSKTMFYNTTSSSWVSSYTNPASPMSPAYTGNSDDSTQPLHSTAQKAGLGVGLGLGTAALIGIVIVWYWYSRRLRLKRSIREKELRELALGAERYYNTDVGRGGAYPEMRTASWGSRQERRIGNPDEDYPWDPEISQDEAGRLRVKGDDDDHFREAERTGLLLDVPSPTRGLRRSLTSRGPPTALGPAVGGAPSTVFRIDEEEEDSQGGSLRRPKSPVKLGDALGSNRYSDPFKDPPPPIVPEHVNDPAAAQRRKEAQGWVDDWSAAAERMRFPEHHKQTGTERTYSNLSENHSNSGGNTSSSGRGSPDKSDRTGSNLSEQSMFSNNSIQRSIAGTVSRTISQRSASAGYALFAGAAAAVARATGATQPRVSPTRESYGTVNTGKGALAHSPSKRSTSLNLNSTGSSARGHGRKRSETFSTARTSIVPMVPGEDQALLSRMNSRAVDDRDAWATPPESPVKQYPSQSYDYTRSSSLGSQAGRRAMGIFGSVKRVFTGTGQVDVGNRVAQFEAPGSGSSPVKGPQMSEVPQRPTSASATFWRGKQGRRDWEDDPQPEGSGNLGTVRRKTVPAPGQENDIEDDWDPEEAVQNRVVQVMFTVPKEKLRVVNVDQLSLLSKSDVDFEGGENEGEKEVKRMSSVVEKEEGEIEVGQAVTTDLDVEPPPLPQQDFIEVAKRSDKGKEKEILRKAVGTPPKRVLSMPKYQFEELS